MKNKSLIVIDESNLYYGFKKQRWKLDYDKFYHWLNKNFNPIDIYCFGGIIAKKAYFDSHKENSLCEFIKKKKDRENFFRILKKIGYKVVTKPVESVYDNTSGNYKRKCNFDVEITILALDRVHEYEELILCSGDGDFVKLLKYLKGKYKKTTTLSHKDRINSNLKETANRVIFFKEIRKEIEKKKGLP